MRDRTHKEAATEARESAARWKRRLLHRSREEASADLMLHHLVRHNDVPLPDFPILSGTLSGLKFVMPVAREPGSIERRLTERGQINMDDFLLRRQFMHGRAMIDVGAHIGTTSIPHAVFKDVDYILAIEPNPDTARCLRHNVAANGVESVFTVHQAAVGASRNVGTMADMGASARAELNIEANSSGDVSVIPLDDLWRSWGHSPSFVKVDVQGYELEAIKGARDLLSGRSAIWHIEVSPNGIKKFGGSISEFTDLCISSFDKFLDTRSDSAQFRPIRDLENALIQLNREFTDFIFVP